MESLPCSLTGWSHTSLRSSSIAYPWFEYSQIFIDRNLCDSRQLSPVCAITTQTDLSSYIHDQPDPGFTTLSRAHSDNTFEETIMNTWLNHRRNREFVTNQVPSRIKTHLLSTHFDLSTSIPSDLTSSTSSSKPKKLPPKIHTFFFNPLSVTLCSNAPP